MRKHLAILTAILCGVSIPLLRAQEEHKQKHEPAKQHQLLKQFEGDWDFKVQCNAPGKEAMTGQGVQMARVTLGGFWLVCEDKGTDSKSEDFSGVGLIGFNPHTEKFCGTWVDSHSPHMWRFEGDVDSTGKVFTFKVLPSEGHGAMKEGHAGYKESYKEGKEGATQKEGMPHMDKMVQEIQDRDHRTLKFYGKDETGKEVVWTEITFTRRTDAVK